MEPSIPLRPIDYQSNGVRLKGYLADGSRGVPSPGVLVAHEAVGINDHTKERAQALAELGYVAFALDLCGEQGFPVEEATARHVELMSKSGLLLERAQAGLDVLTGSPGVDPRRLAAIGYCQGGIAAVELARSGAPLRCAVGFHPGLTRPTGSPDGHFQAKVLMMIGHDDPVLPQADRVAFAAEMNAKRIDWQLHVFGGVGHTYTNPAVNALGRPGFAYNATADRRSWSMMLALLQEEFGTLPIRE